MIKDRPFKSKILLIITNMKEEVIDNEKTVRAVNTLYETVKGKDLWTALEERPAAHPIEFVSEKPSKFQFGVLYILKDGKRGWIYNLIGENSNEE